MVAWVMALGGVVRPVVARRKSTQDRPFVSLPLCVRGTPLQWHTTCILLSLRVLFWPIVPRQGPMETSPCECEEERVIYFVYCNSRGRGGGGVNPREWRGESAAAVFIRSYVQPDVSFVFLLCWMRHRIDTGGRLRQRILLGRLRDEIKFYGGGRIGVVDRNSHVDGMLTTLNF